MPETAMETPLLTSGHVLLLHGLSKVGTEAMPVRSCSVETLCQTLFTCKQHLVLLICITFPNDMEYACLPKTRT